jgi:hypothetical protein
MRQLCAAARTPVVATSALAGALGLVGCAGTNGGPATVSPATAGEVAEIAGYEFHLAGHRLRYLAPDGSASTLAIDAPSPCRLSRDPDGRVRTHEVRSELVFLVVCSEVEREIAGRPFCDTRIRGVVVGDDGVRLPDREQRVGACPPFPWDEQMFVYFVETSADGHPVGDERIFTI